MFLHLGDSKCHGSAHSLTYIWSLKNIANQSLNKKAKKSKGLHATKCLDTGLSTLAGVVKK
jgi:hypothetical protein